MMKRAVLILASISLVGTACSDSLDTGADTASVATTAATEASAAPTTEAPASETPTTEASATTAEELPPPPATGGGEPLVPEVVCVGDDFTVHFGYDNQNDVVVAAEGADNVLSGAVPDDDPFVPTYFAPGRSTAVFYAWPADDPAEVTWELTGPDGETRTAAPAADTPNCNDVPDRLSADPRTPAFEVTRAELDEATDEVTVDIELTGVPALSVCNPAFDAEPAIIRLEDPNGEVLAEGTTVTLSTPVFDYQTIGRAAGFNVSAVVIDRCSFDGTTFSSWPTGEFVALYNSPGICVSVADGAPEVVGDSCSDIPPTGGTKIRNG